MPQVKNMERTKRLHHARSFMHERVRIVFERDNEMTGRVVCIAVPNVGVADMLILQRDHPEPDYVYSYCEALSLATIKTIERVR